MLRQVRGFHPPCDMLVNHLSASKDDLSQLVAEVIPGMECLWLD